MNERYHSEIEQILDTGVYRFAHEEPKVETAKAREAHLERRLASAYEVIARMSKNYAMVQLEDVLAIINRRIEEAKRAGTIALAAHLLSLKKELEGRKSDDRSQGS